MIEFELAPGEVRRVASTTLPTRYGVYTRHVYTASAVKAHVATLAVLPFVLLLGLLFAYERERSGRIYAGIATHYAINVALYGLGHR